MPQPVTHSRRATRGHRVCAVSPWARAVAGLSLVLLLGTLVALALAVAGCGGELLSPVSSLPLEGKPTTSASPSSTAPTAVGPSPSASVSSTAPSPSVSVSSTTRPQSRLPVDMVRVVDGDTVLVRLPGGAEERVRLIGIDAPETSHPDKAVERMGQEAAARIAEFLARGPLELELDVEERDQYGRLLAYVWAGDVFVNLELVRAGFASVFTVPPNVRYAEEFLRAQREAREAERGLWAPETATSGTGMSEGGTSATGVVPWDMAAGHVGERVTVEGPVVGAKWASTSRGSPTFLDLGRPYPDPARFTVLIWGEYRGEFPRAPESAYRGRVIRVTGDVSLYKGVAQMEVMGPDQIQVVE